MPNKTSLSSYLFYTLTLTGLALLAWLNNGNERLSQLNAQTIYDYKLTMEFKADKKDISVATYLPESSPRQTVLFEQIKSPGLSMTKTQSINGLNVRWRGGRDAKHVSYNAHIKTQAAQYNIDKNVTLDDIKAYASSQEDRSDSSNFLTETDAIPVNHPEIIKLWRNIKPIGEDSNRIKPVLTAIYKKTSNLEPLPFKGFTSALTALRLGAASCNGKSRLFASLARLNGIPTRLVGGVIMTNDRKRTSHQWVEVQILGHWVPFDPTNGYFAELPAHYLELYRGDLPLFKHTANIRFDYSFLTLEKKVTPAFYSPISDAKTTYLNLSEMLKPLNLPENVIISFLLFPFCALLVTFFRNVVGIPTFGVFVPLLLAVACSYTGLKIGLLSIFSIIVLAFATLKSLETYRVLKIPRLAATISVMTIAMLIAIHFSDITNQINLSVLALLPVVIVSFVAENIMQHASEGDWSGILKKISGTVFVVVFCFFAMESIYLRGIFSIFPEAFLLVLLAKVYIGRWNGIRLSELFRFKTLLKKGAPVIGINERNREAVYRLNNSRSLQLATDKLATKRALEKHEVPVPQTIFQCGSQSQLSILGEVMNSLDSFVMKPNKGSQGNGIIVIAKRKNEYFYSSGGKRYSASDLLRHASDILSGSYSQNGEADHVYLEPVIQQEETLTRIAPHGLSDIRVIIINGRIAAAMLRLPTKESDGKANLHQGAIGVAVDLIDGRLGQASLKGIAITAHPDTEIEFNQITLPYWKQIKRMALKSCAAVPLGYLGIDICIDKSKGPLVLEVNGRPGLEIQNIQQKVLPRELIYQTAV